MGLVDEDFADVAGIVEQDYVVPEDAVVGGAAEALEILEEQDGIVAVEKAAAGIEDKVGFQAGRKAVSAFVDERWR